MRRLLAGQIGGAHEATLTSQTFVHAGIRDQAWTAVRRQNVRRTYMSDREPIDLVYFSMAPSTHAIGPAVTIDSLVTALSKNYDARVISLNYDFSKSSPLFGGTDPIMVTTPSYSIMYLPYRLLNLHRILKTICFDGNLLIIHCLYDYRLAIPSLLISLLMRPDRTVIHMPHGVFMDVIQKKNWLRKRLFCSFLNWPPVRTRVLHVASSEREASEARQRIGPKARIKMIPHFFGDFSRFFSKTPPKKTRSSLTLAFVGRIAVQKNLLFAIETLASANVPAQLHVFGEESDLKYLCECQKLAQELGVANLLVFRGMLSREALFEEISKLDLFFAPTRGENFGQAIFEALSLGVPVLLSTETPWLDVGSYNAGWALDLTAKDDFAAALRLAFDADEEIWSRYRTGARRYALAQNKNENIFLAWQELFEDIRAPARR